MNEYIEREPFEKRIEEERRYLLNRGQTWAEQVLVKHLLDILYAQPTADVVEVIHAHWIENWESGWSDCSHCGKGYLWEDYKGVADWEYCPNCGARMDLQDREERR